MRDRLLSLPGWALFLALGSAWFVVFFVINLISGDEVRPALGLAAIGGAVLGLATTVPAKFRWRAEQRALGEVAQTDRSAAIRASRTGPVPADADVRNAARELAEADLQRLLRWRPAMTVVLVALVASEIAVAFYSPWSLLAMVFIVPGLAFQLFVFPKRLRARIALLSAAR